MYWQSIINIILYNYSLNYCFANSYIFMGKHMELQQILSLTRKCIDKYNLIDDNDVIAISCSGGKDSLTLSVALNALKRFYPHHFDIKAVTVDAGFKNVNFDELKAFFDKESIEFHIIPTNIAEIVFDIRNESNPCALCSKAPPSTPCLLCRWAIF